MVKGVSHIGFYSADFDAMVDFYCGLLGFKDAFEFRREDGSAWLRFIRISAGQYLELIARDTLDAQSGPYAHLCLEVEDVPALAEKVRAAGIPLIREPACGVTGNWTFWAADPEGNQIEFVQVMEDSVQAKLERELAGK
ncbi:MAG: VOC family protein [Christensenellaceae bacterium]|nr:VOC family protein [Christensenellaceae bacterium]